MNIEEFEKTYKGIKARDYIEIHCSRCDAHQKLFKHKAKNNIQKNGEYVCRRCRSIETNPLRVYTEEGRNRISKANSYKRSELTKQKMSLAKTEFFKTEAGLELKRKLSILTAKGHAENKYENAKRTGWHESPKAGKVFFGSSYELLYCLELDQDDEVKTYETQIMYEIEDRGRCLDFLITYQDNSKHAVEVKPLSRINESANINQINDSALHAVKQGWLFSVITEDFFGMTCKEIRDHADKILSETTPIDWVALRKELNRKKAKKHYDTKISTDTVEVFCDYCNEIHQPLRKTYNANIKRNGEYVCERKGGAISGKKPKKKKENPYVAEGKKQCNRCEKVKLFEEFSPDKTKTDGLSTRCKTCRAEVYKKQYQENKKTNH